MSWSPLLCFLKFQDKYVYKHTHTHFSYRRRPANFHYIINGQGTQRVFICVFLAGYSNKIIKFCVKRLNRCLLFFYFKLQTLTANFNLLYIYLYESWMFFLLFLNDLIRVWLIDCLILTSWWRVYAQFMSRSLEIMFIVHSYLYFLSLFLKRFFKIIISLSF